MGQEADQEAVHTVVVEVGAGVAARAEVGVAAKAEVEVAARAGAEVRAGAEAMKKKGRGRLHMQGLMHQVDQQKRMEWIRGTELLL